MQRRTYLQRKKVIAEHNDLVPSLLVIPDQMLARLDLVRIHAPEEGAQGAAALSIGSIKLGSHVTPNLRALGVDGRQEGGRAPGLPGTVEPERRT